MFWAMIIMVYRFFGRDVFVSRFCDKAGYRRAAGGRWGLWEIDWAGCFMIWISSECDHYPMPMRATHTEPLEIEVY